MHLNEVTIEPRRGLKLWDRKELLEYRDLFLVMVWRNVRTGHAQFANGVPYAIFSYAALVPWTYFGTSLIESTSNLVTNAQI